MTRNGSIWQNIDWWTVAIFAALCIFGWLNIYGASYNYDQTSMFDFHNRAGKQFVWMITSVFIGIIVLLIDSKFYDLSAYYLYGFMLLLLLATPLFTHDIKGSYSWIILGPVSFQPAEFAKCITALAVAKFMGRYEYKYRTWRDLVVPAALIGVPMLVIMVWQRETGTALVFSSFMLMFYRQGMSGWVLVVAVLAALFFIIVIRFGFLSAAVIMVALYAVMVWRTWKRSRTAKWWLTLALFLFLGYAGACNFAFEKILQPHQRTRIEVLLGMKDDPQGAGYNVMQSKIAIGSGGFFGKGYLQGTQTKLHYVPEQDTDFIFCTVGEEWGFVGAACTLLLYLALILRIISLAERQRDMFSRIYVYIVAGVLFFHVTINVGMVLGLLPVIGIPLPFFSYGGSSLWGFTLLLFILLRLDAARVEKL